MTHLTAERKKSMNVRLKTKGFSLRRKDEHTNLNRASTLAVKGGAQAVAEEFPQHANEEQGHADMIAERITQLNDEPNLNPDGLSARSHSQYKDDRLADHA